MNILVTGANGQLGNEMRALSAENGQHTYFFTDVQELDICDEQAIRAFVRTMFSMEPGIFLIRKTLLLVPTPSMVPQSWQASKRSGRNAVVP